MEKKPSSWKTQKYDLINNLNYYLKSPNLTQEDRLKFIKELDELVQKVAQKAN